MDDVDAHVQCTFVGGRGYFRQLAHGCKNTLGISTAEQFCQGVQFVECCGGGYTCFAGNENRGDTVGQDKIDFVDRVDGFLLIAIPVNDYTDLYIIKKIRFFTDFIDE